MLDFVFTIAGWLVLSIIVGQLGKSRKIGFGKAFFISFFLSPLIGFLVLLASKSLSESELAEPKVSDLSSTGIIFLRRGQFEDALQTFRQAYELDRTNQATCFNLGVTYSLMENAEESFLFLQKAVENGYHDFDNIKTNQNLSYIHSHPAYPAFVSGGFRLAPGATIVNQPETDNVAALEKLANLKDRGLLSDEEFQAEKQKILSRGLI